MAVQGLSPEQQRRQAALQAMNKFADEHGASNRAWTESDEGGVVSLVGITDDGRRFSIGYEKCTEEEGVRA